MKNITLMGEVFSGGGKGKKFVALDWVKQQIEQKLGFIPFPGTLNLKLSEESFKHRGMLEKASSIRICPKTGYCIGKLIRASIEIFDCAIVVPDIDGYPETLLEIISPVNLREKLQVYDGDEVTVVIQF